MPDLYIVFRNQADVAMSSIGGERFNVLLLQDTVVLYTQPVDLFLAEVLFFNLPAGIYEVLVIHPQVNPPQVQQRIRLDPQTAVMGLRFIYSEPEQQLLRVEVQEYRSNG